MYRNIDKKIVMEKLVNEAFGIEMIIKLLELNPESTERNGEVKNLKNKLRKLDRNVLKLRGIYK